MSLDRSRQSGLGLVAAIFLIVVSAALAVALTRMVRTSGDGFGQDVVAHRAFLAAETGAQLGLNRVFAPAGAGSCATWTWTLEPIGLGACVAEVRCSVDMVEGAPYYTVESDGRCDSGRYVAERRILVRAAP
ncbi:MAG: hypothetical protein RIB46_19665 [Pseudomonadales bacterium]